MSPFVSALDTDAKTRLDRLDAHLAAFYNGPQMTEYMAVAEAVNEDWSDKPFHRLLLSLVKPGTSLADLGCGSAHVFSNLAYTGVRYTGFDWNRQQMVVNDARFAGKATFKAVSLYDIGEPTGSYDGVCTFYTIEHLSRPHLFLEEAIRLVGVGGFFFILCPRFRKQGHMPSLYYGPRVLPLKEKIRRRLPLDALQHLFRRNILYPWLLRQRFPRTEYPFLINTEPSCLRGNYYSDNDAVYFVCRDEIVEFLNSKRFKDETSSYVDLRDVPNDVCLVIARQTD